MKLVCDCGNEAEFVLADVDYDTYHILKSFEIKANDDWTLTVTCPKCKDKIFL